MRILFCGTGWYQIVDFIRARLPDHEIVIRDPGVDLSEQVADAEVLLPSNGRIDAALLERAPKLRLIQQPAAGYEGVDLDAARARDIPVCNAPGKNATAVGEAALMLMLMIARRWPEAQQVFRDRGIGVPAGRQLRRRHLGILGMGSTGRAFAGVAEMIGMRVRGISSSATPDDLRSLLAESDVISVHVPLTDETRGMLDAEAFAAMKPGAWLIHCARGPIVDREAMIAALDSGQLGAVGLDVHWNEPPDPNDPLYARPNVVALPHVAGSTEEAFEAIADVVAFNVERLEAGEPLVHRVS